MQGLTMKMENFTIQRKRLRKFYNNLFYQYDTLYATLSE